MKTLITGGCGFLGSNLAAALLEKREDILLLELGTIQDYDSQTFKMNVQILRTTYS